VGVVVAASVSGAGSVTLGVVGVSVSAVSLVPPQAANVASIINPHTIRTRRHMGIISSS
jgi:hypothetical protein